MIRVLLCGEGQHELGVDLGEELGSHGWMQALIARLTTKKTAFKALRRREIFLPEKRQKRLRPLPSGHGAKALLARMSAAGEYDIVVYMVDTDSKQVARWREIVEEIEEGFRRAGDNGVIAIACVPMCTSECWLLADAGAWQRLGLRTAGALPGQPEQAWGSRNSPDHPHHVFRAACEAAGLNDDFDTRAALAGGMSLDVVTRQCSVSFMPFRMQISQAFDAVQGCTCGEECCLEIRDAM